MAPKFVVVVLSLHHFFSVKVAILLLQIGGSSDLRGGNISGGEGQIAGKGEAEENFAPYFRRERDNAVGGNRVAIYKLGEVRRHFHLSLRPIFRGCYGVRAKLALSFFGALDGKDLDRRADRLRAADRAETGAGCNRIGAVNADRFMAARDEGVAGLFVEADHADPFLFVLWSVGR
jgi:hypothetical protein